MKRAFVLFRSCAACICACVLMVSAAGAGPLTLQHFEPRLRALSPERPLDYFELGEEIAAEVQGVPGRETARALFALAYELDRTRERRLGASACLALAAIAEHDEERRRLLALASLLRREHHDPEAPGVGAPRPRRLHDPEDAYNLATALGLYRAGENVRAAPLLARPGVRELLEIYAPVIGGAEEILWDVGSRASCRECRNRRVVRAAPGQSAERLCPLCKGNPGPELSPTAMAMHLRLESLLLSRGERTWSAQLIADAGAPLRDIDPDSLAPRYAVSADRPYWRAGGWVSPSAIEDEDAAGADAGDDAHSDDADTPRRME
ncbi:MAG: hypothetical protein EA379_10380 [Phycisphaerales bacterium]|nr:MAG: hypothetical protein EA379_10380 [Phycisphaerales bacterium]